MSHPVIIATCLLPIVIVGCKSDLTEMLEKEYGYKDAHFDFIQQYLRRICLSYGAALIYASSKKDKNCDVLLQFIRHKLYGFDFVHKLQLVEKDTILMPSGADSIKKIPVDFENQNLSKDPEEPFEEVIKIPKRLQILHNSNNIGATVITVDDDQEFLSKHKEVIEKELAEGKDLPKPKPVEPAIKPQEREKEPTSTPMKPTAPSVEVINKLAPPSATSLTSTGVSPDREHQVLADFFNSLIHKDHKPGGPGGVPPGSRKPDIKDLKDLKDLKIPARTTAAAPGTTSPSFNNREDVAKQLDRIRNKYQGN